MTIQKLLNPDGAINMIDAIPVVNATPMREVLSPPQPIEQPPK